MSSSSAVTMSQQHAAATPSTHHPHRQRRPRAAQLMHWTPIPATLLSNASSGSAVNMAAGGRTSRGQSHPHQARPQQQRRGQQPSDDDNVHTGGRLRQQARRQSHYSQRRSARNDDHSDDSADRNIYDDDAAESSNPLPGVTMEMFSGCSVQAKSVIQHIITNTLECIICSEVIGRRGRTWNCSQCSALLHHSCISRYYQTMQVAAAASLSANSSKVDWRCPACQFVMVEPPAPYHCFCGKVSNPEAVDLTLPHSCAQACGKLLQCGQHHCTSLCHPASCAKCTAVGATVDCYCGRSTVQLRCGEINDATSTSNRSCGSVCNRPLACGQHMCTELCHSGACKPCTNVIEQSCYCGEHVNEPRLCSESDSVQVSDDGSNSAITHFKCDKVCNKLLGCGNHRCDLKCHAGDCAACSRQPTSPQPCACGKTTTEAIRQTCLEPLPTCDNTCDKPLSCGRHQCLQRCHDSPCESTNSAECHQMMQLACRCLRSVQDVPCNKYDQLLIDEHTGERIVQCTIRCPVKLSCGRHRCDQPCCSPAVNAEHLCLRMCEKPLACGRHTCPAHCHSGNCTSCNIIYHNGMFCRCGRTRTAKNTICGSGIRPICSAPCSKPRNCPHPCKYSCSECSGDTCPPCAVLTSVSCACKRRVLNNVPCYNTKTPPSCGAKCGQPLPCGVHTCNRRCHSGPCGHQGSLLSLKPQGSNLNYARQLLKPDAAAEEPEGDQPVCCGQKCLRPLSACGHPHKDLCHGESECQPSTPCSEMVTIACSCGRKSQQLKCIQSRVTSTLDCDDECERRKRNNAFKDALGIKSVADRATENTTPSLTASIPYPVQLLEQIIKLELLPSLPKLEKQMSAFVLSADVRINFPPMTPNQRWLVHSIAQSYGVLSESVDRDPRRSVRVVKSDDGFLVARIPSMLLYEACTLYRTLRNKALIAGKELQVDSTRQLHLYGLSLSPAISTHDLNTLLRKYSNKFQCHWMTVRSRDHCVLTCDTEHDLYKIKQELCQVKEAFSSEVDKGSEYFDAHDVEVDGQAIYRKHAAMQSRTQKPVSRSNSTNNTQAEWEVAEMLPRAIASIRLKSSNVKPTTNQWAVLNE